MAEANFREISLKENIISKHFFVNVDQCLYAHRSKRGDVKYIQCIDEGCPAKGKITRGFFSRTNDDPHSHEDNHAEVAAYEIAFERLRALVKTDPRPVRTLHQEVLSKLSRDASAMLSWRHCHRTLERIRNDMLPPCRSLIDLVEIMNDDGSFGYLSYGNIRNTRFYQGSVDGNPIFANRELIAELGQDLDLFVDGTFSVSPFKSRQLLVILGELGGKPRPLIYAVMQGQSTADYAAIFSYLRDNVFCFDGTLRTPVSATSDFELAIRLALLQIWPNINVYGCNFHFCQTLRRQARSLESLSANLVAGVLHNKVLTMFTRLPW